ncbi:GrpB family protein [Ensifer sp. MJa1]
MRNAACLCKQGNSAHVALLQFRDALRECPDRAHRHEALKRRLAAQAVDD